MAKQEVVMPALGMAMTHGTLLQWMKQAGDRVEIGDPVAEVETDKANIELESEFSGFLGAHLFEAGALVPVGAAVAEILDSETPEAAAAGPADSAAAKTLAPAKPVKQAPKHKTSAAADREEFRQKAVLLDKDAGAAALETDITGLPAEELVEWLQTMMLIREFETVSDRLALSGKIPGGMHSAAGQEAVAVGSIRALAPTDIVTSSHRSHHHSLAKGLTPRSVMAELFGKETGILGGRGGHMHLADFDIGLFGSNGIVGGGLGLAMGASLASKMRHLDQVALGFFGDGGANTGRVWESINLASLWKLPLIVICENNLYAVETHVARATASDTIAGHAAGFSLPALQVDGQDVVAVYKATSAARRRALDGDGPTFIEALTYRYKGHNTGDRETYRTKDEVDDWRATKDPIARLTRALEGAGILSDGQLDQMTESVQATVEDAVTFAEASAWPDIATASDRVTGLAVAHGA
jgi:TPP-dependent pyruvate/acetoin dehydrogenase alpha subunit